MKASDLEKLSQAALIFDGKPVLLGNHHLHVFIYGIPHRMLASFTTSLNVLV